MSEMQKQENENIPEASAVRLACYLALIPLAGFLFYIPLTFLGLIQIGRGRTGFYLLRKGLIAVLLLSVIPIAGLIWWAELPGKYYAAFQIPRHGRFETTSETIKQSEFYRFGYLFKRIVYYPDGGHNYEEYLSSDKRQGPYTEWFESGKIAKQFSYNNGEFHGACREWYPNGNLLFSAEYLKGVPVNTWECWHSNGKILCRGTFANGLYSGLWTGWHDNSQKRFELSYNKSIANGLYSSWYDNGQIAIQGEYKNGDKIGNWISYDKTGKVVYNIPDYLKFIAAERFFNTKKSFMVISNIPYLFYGHTPSRNSQGIAIPPGVDWRVSPDLWLDTKQFKEAVEDLTPHFLSMLRLMEFDSSEGKKFDTFAEICQGMPVDKLDFNGCGRLSLLYLKGRPVKELEINISNEDLPHLTGLPLRRISKSFDSISLKYIKGMSLESLEFSDDITPSDIAIMKDMPLKEMTLSGDDLTNSSLDLLNAIPLNKIIIEDSGNITLKGLLYLKKLPLNYFDLTKIADKLSTNILSKGKYVTAKEIGEMFQSVENYLQANSDILLKINDDLSKTENEADAKDGTESISW